MPQGPQGRKEILEQLGHDPANPMDYPEPWRSTTLTGAVPAHPRDIHLMGQPAESFLPDVVKSAAVPVTVPTLSPETQSALLYEGISGLYSQPHRPLLDYLRPSPKYRPQIKLFPEVINRVFGGEHQQVLTHEVGHSIWLNSLNRDDQKRWQQVHAASIRRAPSTVTNPGTADVFLENYQLDPFRRYPDDPAHSFADAYGRYVTDPEWLKRSFPEAYNFFKNKFGFEYSRRIGRYY